MQNYWATPHLTPSAQYFTPSLNNYYNALVMEELSRSEGGDR